MLMDFMISFLLLALGFISVLIFLVPLGVWLGSLFHSTSSKEGLPGSPVVKNLTSNIGKKEMVTHSSTLAWKIPWMEEPGMLQSMGSHRVGHD